jgi:stearoyl-CoA desaturase (delta-9 desaturase)
MAENLAPSEVVLGLVRVINGESPRLSAKDYLDPSVNIHMDSARHCGIELWYKWIYLIRNCGRICNLYMTPCKLSCDRENPNIVHLSIRWSGIERSRWTPVVAPEIYHLRYLVENCRIIEVWTTKSNYIFIFGSWIRYSILYRLLFLWAIFYFAILSLRGKDYHGDNDEGRPAKSRTQKEGLKSSSWQRFTRSKWTFLLFHLLCLLYCVVGRVDFIGSFTVWFVMQMGVHSGYHRYFSHASFRTYPWFEFILGCAGCLAFQNGPLWWASKHRRHHQFADTGNDLHSPTKGFWHSHVGWLWSKEADDIDCKLIPDLLRPIPIWIESYQVWIHVIYVSTVYLLGGWNGLLAWWITPVVVCWHTTFATNSFCHTIGSHPYKCRPYGFCMARNNFLVAIANLGEGWHSNHHANPSRCHHGFYRWYQLDIVYIVLLFLEKLGIVWGLKRQRRTRGRLESKKWDYA